MAPEYQVVVSFRALPAISKKLFVAVVRRHIEELQRSGVTQITDLDVAVREIGAGGERSEDEGRYDRPSALARTEDLDPDRPTRDIPGGGRL